jgi:hypothetical protein
MNELQRLTSEYIEAEDRLRISGQLGSGETVVMWMTQRLLNRFLPHLCLWLEKQGSDSLPVEIAQSFAQEAATQELRPESPVTGHENALEYLVDSVDITPEPGTMRLVFRAGGDQQSHVELPSTALRQWLSILHSQWLLAQWPGELWPEWMQGNLENAKGEDAQTFH